MLETVTPISEKIADALSQISRLMAKRKQSVIISYSLPWPQLSLLDFLQQAPNAPRVFWASAKTPLGFAGYDIAATLTARGADRFQKIQQQSSELFESIVILNNKETPLGIGPRLFGGFSFRAPEQAQPLWTAFPAARFILPRYQLSYDHSRDHNKTWLTINHHFGMADDPVEIAHSLYEEIEGLREAATTTATIKTGDASSRRQQKPLATTDLIAPAKWNNLVTETTRRIRRGELDKVVLARARRMKTALPIDVIGALANLERNYPDCYRFLFEPVPGHAFYGATPELLAEVTGPELHTAALAGSIRRGSSPSEDETLGQELMANPKERIEHALVVEAIQENLQPIVSELHIASQPNIYRLSNIQHLQTVIEAQLPAGCNILTVVEALHPTPALGGRPRHLALPLINQAEPLARGWYGAPVGWLDYEGNGMFAVAIRSAVSVDRDTLLYAGAGIVADSVPEKEWQETELKFRPLMEALTGAKS